MDITKEYIEMCEKAIEIQKSKEFFNAGDFWFYKGCLQKSETKLVIQSKDRLHGKKNVEVWLPR